MADLQYSSDRIGLVWAYELRPDAAGRAVGSEEVEAWLAADARENAPAFLWLHFSLANSATERWLRQRLTLPEAFFESLGAGSPSTRVEHVSGALVAVVNGSSVSGGAEGVGRVTTMSVVQSICMIVVADMLFAYIATR